MRRFLIQYFVLRCSYEQYTHAKMNITLASNQENKFDKRMLNVYLNFLDWVFDLDLSTCGTFLINSHLMDI
jgi:hypothetical protein